MRSWILFAVIVSACAHAPAPVKDEAPPPVAAAPVAAAEPARDPDAEIQVSGELGTIDEDAVERVFRSRWNDITACYQRAQADLWYVGGRVEIKLRITTDGAVKRSWVAASTMGNYEAERCMLEATRTLAFPRPRGGKEAEVSFPVEFRSRAAVADWDPGRVAPAMKRHRSDVLACKRGTRMPRELTLTLYVAPGGRVTSAGLAADAPVDERLGGCLVQKVRAWRLDDPLGKIAKASVGVRD